MIRKLGLAAFSVALIAVLMVWFPMARTTAMVFIYVVGFVCGFVLARTMNRSE